VLCVFEDVMAENSLNRVTRPLCVYSWNKREPIDGNRLCAGKLITKF
jgi:hypothetical protein